MMQVRVSRLLESHESIRSLRRRRLTRTLLACALPFAAGCGDAALTGTGGSSQTINATVHISDTTMSVSAEDTAVKLLLLHAFSQGYRPYDKIGQADSIASVEQPALSWKAPQQGRFNFLITAKPSGSACFLQNITLQKGAANTIRCTLGPCRNIAGVLAPPDCTPAPLFGSERYAISILGSPFFATTDSLLGFVIGNLPYGGYTISVRLLAQKPLISAIEYSIDIDSLFGNKQVRMVLP